MMLRLDNIENEDDLGNYLIKRGIDIVEMYDIYSIEDLMKFEFIMITNKCFIIRKCKYCGQYFILSGRSDLEYCNSIVDGETKPCNQIGASKVYQQEYENDTKYQLYQRAYKRYNTRVQKKQMSKADFYKWLEQAKKWLDKCYNGEINENELNTLLENK